jgi:hypothetical protein
MKVKGFVIIASWVMSGVTTATRYGLMGNPKPLVTSNLELPRALFERLTYTLCYAAYMDKVELSLSIPVIAMKKVSKMNPPDARAIASTFFSSNNGMLHWPSTKSPVLGLSQARCSTCIKGNPDAIALPQTHCGLDKTGRFREGYSNGILVPVPRAQTPEYALVPDSSRDDGCGPAPSGILPQWRAARRSAAERLLDMPRRMG